MDPRLPLACAPRRPQDPHGPALGALACSATSCTPSSSQGSLFGESHAEPLNDLGSLRSPVEVEGNKCFPPLPKKDLESPS